MRAKDKVEMDAVIAEDALIQGLLSAMGKRVEVIAFGICYAGKLQDIDVDNGTVVIVEGEDRAMLEIERIKSFSLLKE